MTIYEDYENWKDENFDLINDLIKMKSKIISRFSHVIAVVDYLYNKHEQEGSLEEYLEVIFEHGFDYLHDHFVTISTILQKEYRGNLVGMNEYAKTINLLLYTNDFQNELENDDNAKQEDLDKLNDFEQRVLSYIEKHEEAPDEMFGLLNDITYNLFDENYRSVNDILYDVALELDLAIDDNGEAPIDNIFGIREDEI